MPGGRKPGMNLPLFTQGPAGYAPGPAQLQVGPKVRVYNSNPLNRLSSCTSCTSCTSCLRG